MKYKDIIIKHFSSSKILSTREVFDIFRKYEENISKNTVNWRLHQLVVHGVLSRTGRGVYTLAKQKILVQVVTETIKKIAGFLNTFYPLVTWCGWSTEILSTLTQHVPKNIYTLIDVESDSKESITSNKIRIRSEYNQNNRKYH